MTIHPDLSDGALWKRRCRVAMYRAPQVAPANPERGLVLSNEAGSYQLCAWEVPAGATRQLTQKPAGLREGWLSSDGRWVYHIEDQKGDETGHFVRVPWEGGSPQDLTPELPPYSSWWLSESGDSSVIGFTAADDDGHAVYVMERGTGRSLGAPRGLYRSRKACFGPLLSHDGKVAVVAATERSEKNQFALLAFRREGGPPFAELWDGPDTSIEAAEGAFCPVPGDTRLLATSNRSGVARPLVWDPASGERRDLDVGNLPGEWYAEGWSPDGARVLLRRVHNAEETLHIFDLGSDALVAVAQPGGVWRTPRLRADGTIVAGWMDSQHPSQVISLDPRDGAVRTLLSAENVPPAHKLRSVSFPGANGDTIQGWLATPEGDGPFPTVLDTHGGPQMATTEVWSPFLQLWVDHGFALLSINYHGSTTFGKDFEESIIGRVGELEVEDMACAHRWLVESGIAIPDRVFLTGWSYGGYLTLHALGIRPELWAGGMAGIPVADWPSCHEDSAETLRAYDVGLFGGTLAEVRDRFEKASPLAYVENVRAPVLIIQGRNDTRCPARQVELYEARMRALGKPLEVEWFDAGHGSLVIEEVIGHLEKMLVFACRVAGETSP